MKGHVSFQWNKWVIYFDDIKTVIFFIDLHDQFHPKFAPNIFC